MTLKHIMPQTVSMSNMIGALFAPAVKAEAALLRTSLISSGSAHLPEEYSASTHPAVTNSSSLAVRKQLSVSVTVLYCSTRRLYGIFYGR